MYIVNSKQIVDKRTAIETAYKQDILTVFDVDNNCEITFPLSKETELQRNKKPI